MQVLLGRISSDEKCKKLKEQLDRLLPSCKEPVSSSIRAQYRECTDDLQTTEAMLKSWEGFFERTVSSMKMFDEGVRDIQLSFSDVMNKINSADNCSSIDAPKILQSLQVCLRILFINLFFLEMCKFFCLFKI